MNPNEPSNENICLRAVRPHRQAAGILRLFVYGILKRGFWNHDRFCRGVLDIREAVVSSRLYEMSSGIPVLQVPEDDILARGTADPLADVTTQARFAGDLAHIPLAGPGKRHSGRLCPRVRGTSHLRRPRKPACPP